MQKMPMKRIRTMNYRELYESASQRLEAAHVKEAELNARLLLEYLCHTDRSYLLAHGDERVTNEIAEQYMEMIGERVKHIPMQYITNEQEFMGLKFYVNQDVLIPRQDTECLVEEAMRDIQDGMAVLDMCTGSGCIIISLLKYKNRLRCVAADFSEQALGVARHNSLEHGVTEQLRLVQSDMFENAEEIRRALRFLTDAGMQGATDKFDFIISNPPYIRSDVIEELDAEVKEYEPRMALDGAADGLYFYRRIAEQAGGFLASGGKLFLEIGYDQGQDVTDILTAAGFENIKVTKDLAGLDRVVSAGWFNKD